MYSIQVPTLEILVAGDAGSGKANFINKFLKHFPASAEVRRKSATVHLLYNPGRNIKIQLYDVNSVENIDTSACDKIDVVLFYYAAHDPESLRNLEKWVRLMKKQEMHSSPPRTKKEVHSILLADWSDVGNQRDMAKFLSEKANELKVCFGIKTFIQSSFEDEESALRAFEIIMNAVSPPKEKEESVADYCERRISQKTVARRDFLDQYSKDLSRPSGCNCDERHLDEMRKLESFIQGLAV